MRKILLIGAYLLVLVLFAPCQNTRYRPGEIRQKLHQLNVLGSVLYVAAHPDDENTQLITYYANEKLFRTAYLAATRGDGGQNLVGPEIREALGIIRTQELLAARKTDGGQQFFSRANDFGYSKDAEETFTIWDREKVLADFVWVFRKCRPDVIITRFNDEGPNHGHHTASAILAKEAFELAGDPKAFPEQLAYVEIWKPSKIYWNTGWWWFRNSGRDTTGLKQVNMGGYNPLLGASYGEIAAVSRSMHKSQGFGSAGSRGDQIEYLEQWGGEESNDPFEGIDTSWDRVSGSEEVKFYIQKAIEEFDETKPWNIVSSLISARRALEKVTDNFWKSVKRKEIDDLILSISGLHLSFTSHADFYTPGDSIRIVLEAVNRSEVEMSLEGITLNIAANPIDIKSPLFQNKGYRAEMNFIVPQNMDYSNPYWLQNEGELGMYEVKDQKLIGKPENDPPIIGQWSVKVGGESLTYEVPVLYRRTDPVEGEVVEPVSIGPPILMNVAADVMVFGSEEAKNVDVKVIAGKNDLQGEMKLSLPKGWKYSPEVQYFDFTRKNEEQLFTFTISPPKLASEGSLKVVATVDGLEYTKSRVIIDYDHIPKQVVYPNAEIKVVRVDLKKKGELIGYIDGAGDAIPENLEQVGYRVERLKKDQVNASDLAKYDAIVVGIRAFNTVDWLAYKNEELFEYVKKGGTLVVQYNTSHQLVTEKVAPYDLKLSRDRVTVEDAPVEILAGDHPIVNEPNKITPKDFEGWVQERGLYFPVQWSDEFAPIFSSNDPGESPKSGGTLVARYGEGYYVYTGYSWFRELPAGVPGAFRIFVNMISLGK